jgi:hypothetical protein
MHYIHLVEQINMHWMLWFLEFQMTFSCVGIACWDWVFNYYNFKKELSKYAILAYQF